MATSDRLYELCCECRDAETRLDALVRDAARREERLDAIGRAASELVDALEDDRLAGLLPPLSDRVAEALAGLKTLNQ